MGDPRKTFVCKKCGLPMVDDERQRRWGDDTPCPKCQELERGKYVKHSDHLAVVNELVKATEGMLENYLFLKKISLAVARSDRPNWGAGVTEEDIHVVTVREAIAKAKEWSRWRRANG